MLKVIIAVALVAAVFCVLLGINPFKTSEYSNCVIVFEEKHFTGEWLKHSRAASHSRMLTSKCLEKDKEIDSGDGPKKGRVRWAECLQGPDCDEAGMF